MTQAERYIAFLKTYNNYPEKETNAFLDSFTENIGDENFTIFGAWYDQYFNTAGFNGAPWCHDYTSYGAYMTGISPKNFPYTASCGEGVRWFKQRGLWRNKSNYSPMMGDLVYFHWGDLVPAHVGAVRYSGSGLVHTIEGNTGPANDEDEQVIATLVDDGGRVSMKKYPLDYKYILGYGTPMYDTEDDEMDISKLTDTDVVALFDRYNAIMAKKEVPDWAESEFRTAVNLGLTDGQNPCCLIPRYQAAMMAKRAKVGKG